MASLSLYLYLACPSMPAIPCLPGTDHLLLPLYRTPACAPHCSFAAAFAGRRAAAAFCTHACRALCVTAYTAARGRTSAGLPPPAKVSEVISVRTLPPPPSATSRQKKAGKGAGRRKAPATPAYLPAPRLRKGRKHCPTLYLPATCCTGDSDTALRSTHFSSISLIFIVAWWNDHMRHGGLERKRRKRGKREAEKKRKEKQAVMSGQTSLSLSILRDLCSGLFIISRHATWGIEKQT